MSTTPWDEQQAGVVYASSASGIETAETLSLQPTFYSVGGNSANLFTVSTIHQGSPDPIARVALRSDAAASGELLHEIQLELRSGDSILKRYDVSIVLASDHTLATYRADRRSDALELSANSAASGAAVLAAGIDAEGNFTDLNGKNAKIRLEESVGRISALSQHLEGESDAIAIAARTRIYSAVQATADTLKKSTSGNSFTTNEGYLGPISTDRSKIATLERHEATVLNRQLGNAAVLLADQLRVDLRSSDETLRAAAESARDALVASSPFSAVLWNGLQVNSPVQRTATGVPGTVKYSAIYEAGDLQVTDQIIVNAGREAVVEVIERTTTTKQSFAASSVTASVSPTSTAVADTTITNPNVFGGLLGSDPDVAVVNGSSSGNPFEAEGIFKFDVSQFSQYSTQATVTLYPSGLDATSVVHQAVLMENDSWNESAVWSTPGIRNSSAALLTSNGQQNWTVTSSLSPVELDVTDHVRRRLRQGDMNFDFTRQSAGVEDDVTAFEMAVKNPAQFASTYSTFISDTTDVLDRGDLNKDGVVSAADAGAFLAVHGYLQGDNNFDGTVDMLGFLEWQNSFGQARSYFEGDSDFSGIIDSGDLAVWANNYGETPPTPAEDVISVRVFAPTQASSSLPYAYYTSKDDAGAPADHPSITVEQPVDLVATKFGTSTSGQLQLTYSVLNEAVSGVQVKVYRSVDGSALTQELMTYNLPSGGALQPGLAKTANFAANFGGIVLGENDRLVAVVQTASGVGQPSIANQQLTYAGGAFKENSTLYLVGTEGSDSFFINKSGTDFVVTGDFSATIPSSGITSVRSSLFGGNDRLIAQSSVTIPVAAWGSAGSDIIYGGSGIDSLYGGTGNDILIGGGGSDFRDWGNAGGMRDAIRVTTLADESQAVSGFRYSNDFRIESLSLREALIVAADSGGADTIDFAPTTTGVIQLNSGLTLNSDVQLLGPGISQLAISGQNSHRVLRVNSGVQATIKNLKITGGNSDSNGGGGIWNNGTLVLDGVRITANKSAGGGGGVLTVNVGGVVSNLHIINSTIDHNESSWGAGIYANVTGGNLTIEGSTFSYNRGTDNDAYSEGGGLAVAGTSTGSVLIRNSTFSHNEVRFSGGIRFQNNHAPTTIINSTIANNVGGGLDRLSTAVAPLLYNTIIADNESYIYPGTRRDLDGAVSTLSSHNLIGQGGAANLVDNVNNNIVLTSLEVSGLLPLGDYGGPTLTHSLAANSPAIDAGTNVGAPIADQRGAVRPADDPSKPNSTSAYDIGAFEKPVFDLDSSTTGLDGAVTWVVNEGPVELTPNAAIAGLGNRVTTIRVTISNLHDGSFETLTAAPSNPAISWSYSGGALTLTGVATETDFAEALQTVAYDNSLEDPDPSDRLIHVAIMDRDEVLNSATVTVTPKFRATVQLQAVEDTSNRHADGSAGAAVDGEAQGLYVGSMTDSSAYFKFTLPQQLSGLQGAEITSAAFEVFVNRFHRETIQADLLTTQHLYLLAYSLPWSENDPNKPTAAIGLGGTVITSLTASAEQIASFDVTPQISTALTQTISFALAEGGVDDSVLTEIASSESTLRSRRPVLSVTGLFRNSRPTAINEEYEYQLGEGVRVSEANGLLKNAFDADDGSQLTAELVSGPNRGDIVFRDDGSFTYRPDPNTAWHEQDSFKYRVFDGFSYSDEKTVSLNPLPAYSLEFTPNLSWVTRGRSPLPSDAPENLTNPFTEVYNGFKPSGWWYYIDGNGEEEERANMGTQDWVFLPEHQTYFAFDIGAALDGLSDPQNEIVSARLEWESGMDGTESGHSFWMDLDPIDRYPVLGDAVLEYWHPDYWESLDRPEEFYVSHQSSLTQTEFDSLRLTNHVRTLEGGYERGTSSDALLEYWRHSPENRPQSDNYSRDVTALLRDALMDGDSALKVGFLGANLNSSIIGNVRLYVSYAETVDHPSPHVDDESSPNQPPSFVSRAESKAKVGTPYVYRLAASDWENDELTSFVRSVEWPAGYEPGPGDFTYQQDIDSQGRRLPTGTMTWNPPASLVGKTVRFSETVHDGFNLPVNRTFDVLVTADPTRHAPIIWNSPPQVHDYATGNESFGDVSPSKISVDVEYANESGARGEEIVTVSVARRDVPVFGTDPFVLPEVEPNRLKVENVLLSPTTVSAAAKQLVNALTSGGNAGIQISGVNFATVPWSEEFEIPGTEETEWASTTGIFVNDSTTYGLGRAGIVLSTGNAAHYGSGADTMEGRTTPYSDAALDSNSEAEQLLDSITGDESHHDATMLEVMFGVEPGTTEISFDVVFGSEEYARYVGQYNDGFGLYIEEWDSAEDEWGPKHNLATVEAIDSASGTSQGAAWVNINHPQMTTSTGEPSERTELNGVLVPHPQADSFVEADSAVNRFIAKNLSPGKQYRLTFLLADTRDQIRDTTVYISNLGGAKPNLSTVSIEGVLPETDEADVNELYQAITASVNNVRPGEVVRFEVKLKSDGKPHNLDLKFWDHDSNGSTTLLGSIPIAMNTDYVWTPITTDQDLGDTLTYELLEGPEGVNFDPTTGAIRWSPTSEGPEKFHLVVTDSYGLKDSRSWIVDVKDDHANTAPDFDGPNLGTLEAEVGQPFQPPGIFATDLNSGDSLEYYFEAGTAPSGMTISRQTGQINWTPTANQVGLLSTAVKVLVFDRRGGSDSYEFGVNVLPQGISVNSPPQIVFFPDQSEKPAIVTTVEGGLLKIPVRITDAQNHRVTVTVDGPKGVVFDADSGQLLWRPEGDAIVGYHTIILRGDDGHGAQTAESIQVLVKSSNIRPTFNAKPEFSYAGVDQSLEFPLVASDQNGDPLTFEPLSMPPGMQLTIVNDQPQLSWTTPLLGSHRVVVQVSDGRGGHDVLDFVLTVDLHAPPVIQNTPQTITRVGANYNFNFSIASTGAIAALSTRVGVPGILPTNLSQLFLNPEAIAAGVEVYYSGAPATGTAGNYTYGGLSLRWHPTAVGDTPISFKITNDHNASSTLSFVLSAVDVVNVTQAPVFTSLPTGPAVANAGFSWTFDLTGDDPDGYDEGITVEILEMPDEAMRVGSELEWNPTTTETGHFRIKLTDESGAWRIMSFSVPVVSAPQPATNIDVTYTVPASNIGPTMQTTTLGPFYKDQAVDLQLIAQDPNGHAIGSFSLDVENTTVPDLEPNDVTTAGKIVWTPTTAGEYTLSIVVTDQHGAPTTTRYNIVVLSNAAPKIETTAIGKISIEDSFTHDITVSDPNPFDSVTIHPLNPEAIAAGITLARVGDSNVWRITWLTPSVGSVPISIVAEDSHGAKRVFQTTLNAFDPEEEPQTSIGPIDVPAERQFSVNLGGGSSNLTFQWSTAIGFAPPTGATLSTNGELRWTPKFSDINTTPYTLKIIATNASQQSVEVDVVVRVWDYNDLEKSAPSVISTAPHKAMAGETFLYDLGLENPGDRPTRWEWIDKPADMEIVGNQIRWNPSIDLIGKTIPVSLRVVDAAQFGSVHEFKLQVVSTNQRPELKTTIPPVWRLNEQENVLIEAYDPEGHQLHVELKAVPGGSPVPAGMTLTETEDGLFLNWTPTTPNQQLNKSYTFIIRAEEKHRPDSYQEKVVTVTVRAADYNRVPTIDSVPDNMFASIAGGYQNEYQIDVSDLDEENYGFTYEIIAGQSGDMYLNSTTGLLTWSPTVNESLDERGPRTITVKVTDNPAVGQPQSITRTFVLNAIANTPPKAVSEITEFARIGETWTRVVKATDDDPSTVRYRIDPAYGDAAELITAGLVVDEVTGVLRWRVPSNFTATTTPKQIRVLSVDKYNATAATDVDINIESSTSGPAIRIRVIDQKTGAVVQSGGQLIFENVPDGDPEAGEQNDYVVIIELRDVTGSGEFEGQLAWKVGDVVTPFTTPLTESRSAFYFEPSEYGAFSFVVTALDSSNNETTQEFVFTVVDSASNAKAIITSPIVGGAVTEPTDITGSVTLESGQSYVLELVDDFQGITRTIASGASITAPNGSLAVLDPTLVEDGSYRLVLKVVSGTSILAYAERRIEIKNALKIGDLKMSFTDLSVDLGGIPINLTRFYDSKAAGVVGDFGYGWKLGLTSTRAAFSHPERTIANINDSLPLGTRIVVALPDGSQQGFTFTESGGSPHFVPDEGVTTSLSFGNVFNFRSLTASPLYPGELWDGHPDADRFMPWDYADDLVLTSRDGLVYHFDFMDGRLTSISDRGDRSVTIGKVDPLTNKQEITSSSGSLKITVQRNSFGLITEIIDPNGKSVDYQYGTYDSPTFTENASEKTLAKLTNRAGVVTYYEYGEITPSTGSVDALVGSYDGAHVRTLTAGYNLVGRLNQLQDSGGASTQVLYTLDLGDGRSVETIRNDENNFIELVRDDRGNVLLTIVPLFAPGDELDPAERRYLVTESIYDEYSHLLLRQSNPFTVEGADKRFDAHADSPDETPTAWARRLSYDASNRVEFSRDALGAITSYKYDDEDRVVAVIAPDGAVTHTTYDPNTGDLRETYLIKGNVAAKFNHTLFEYELGRLVRTYQVSGANRQLVSENGYFTDGDNYGRLEWTKDAAGVQRYFGYDANGNQTLSAYLWTDGVNVKTIVSRTDYDGEGRALKSYQYDRDGNHVATALAANEYAYSTNDSVVTLNSGLAAFALRSTTETHYDAQGRVDWTQDRFGAQTHSVYNSRGQIIETRSQAKDAGGAPGWLVTRTLYDSQGRVEFASDPYFMLTADYTNNGGAKAWLGTRTVYDSLGRTVRSERYDGVSISIGTDANGQPVTASAFAFYDAKTETGTPPTSVSQTFYDDLGRVQHVIGKSGARTDFYYDAAGRQIATLGPVVTVGGVAQRHLTETAFDVSGRVVQSRSNIAVTAWTTDHPRGITGNAAILHPEDLPPGGAEATVNRSKTQTTFYEYDAAGRQIAVISSRLSDPNGDQDTSDAYHIRTETEYDAFGRRVASRQGIKQTDPFNSATILRDEERSTSYEYDAAGNLTAVNLPTITSVTYQGGSDSNVRPRYEYQYDMYGNRIVVTTNAYLKSDGVTVVYLRKDSLTGQDAFAYSRNLDSELSLSHDAVTTTTTFTFDQRNRQTSRTLPLGVGSTGFVERAIFADGAATTLGSVGNGQLEYTVDFEGRVTAYRYDNTTLGGGRLVEKRFFDNEGLYLAAPNSPAEKVVYAYDGFGRELEVKSYQGGTLTRTVVNGYDSEGRLTSIVAPEGTINYVYDPATGDQTRVYTNETDTTYVYDDLGRLEQVILTKREGAAPVAGNEETRYFYDLVGRLDYERLPGGTTRDSVYDELGRTTRIDSFLDADDDGVWDAGEVRIGAFDYLYDANHQQRSLREEFNLDNAGGVDAVHRYRWNYDALGRLFEESFDDGDDGPSAKDYVDRFSFDVTGNRLEKQRDAGNGVPASFSADETTLCGYDANDRLRWETKDVVVGGTTDDTNTVYEYGLGDAQSAHTRETVRKGSTTLGQGTQVKQQSFVYDRQGRLQQATTVENAQTVVTQYEYDARGVRISRSVDGAKTLFVVDGRNPTGYAQTLEERDATTGEVTTTYTLGLDVVTQAAAAAVYDLLYDAHGSTRAALDGTDAAQFYAYDAHGQLLDSSGFTSALQSAFTSLLYSGEFRDKATGWDYLRARDYNSRTGRFGTLDPFEGLLNDPQSLNAYLYGYGNPINRIDPGGDFPPLLIGILIGAGVGAGFGAGFGAGIGAIDAALGGAEWDEIRQAAWQGAKTGFVVGGILGGAGAVGGATAAFAKIGFTALGVGAGAYGSYSAFSNGNIAQGAFRGALGIASALAFRNALIESLAGAPVQWIGPALVRMRIPKGWQETANSKGVGRTWTDPAKKGQMNEVRLDKGNPAHSFESQKVDHVVVRSGGKVIGRDGKPISGSIKQDPKNAHIPLDEYLTWRRWNEP